MVESLNFSDRTRPSFISVTDAQAGQRLDNFLMREFKNLPKTRVYQMIRKGEVRINKGRVKPTTRVQGGDLLRIPPIQTAERQPAPVVRDQALNELARAVLFEDDAILVLNKPSGWAVHAGSGIRIGVIEALRQARPDLPFLELAHRLDRATSGCLLLAKRASVLRTLNHDIQTKHGMSKNYLCLVKGCWQGATRRVEKPLDVEARRGGERFVRVSQNGVSACSIMQPVNKSKEASLIAVKLLSGRTHQIRVHSVSEGHPIAGDTRYGDPEFNALAEQRGLKRLFLHAHQLTFFHPVSNEKVSIEAPLPDDLVRALGAFGLQQPVDTSELGV